MSRSGKTTMADVARAAGVSITAVSFVMNGHQEVSCETAERVWRVAGELGYQPRKRRESEPTDAQGARQGQVLLLVGDVRIEAAHTRQMTDVARAAARLFSEFGLEMITACISEDGSVPLCIERRQVQGVLFRYGGGLSDGLVSALAAMPCVEFFAQEISVDRDEVVVDAQANAQMAVNYLREHGCERLVVLNSNRENGNYHLNAQAAVHAGQALGWPVELREIKHAERLAKVFPEQVHCTGRTGLYIAGYTEINPPETVDADLCNAGLTPDNNVLAIGSTSRVDCISHAACYNSMARLGRTCAEQLVWRMAHPRAESRRVMVKPELVPASGEARRSKLGHSPGRISVALPAHSNPSQPE